MTIVPIIKQFPQESNNTEMYLSASVRIMQGQYEISDKKKKNWTEKDYKRCLGMVLKSLDYVDVVSVAIWLSKMLWT